MDRTDSLIRRIPGFRTNRKWKKITASSVYALIAWTMLSEGAFGVVLGSFVLAGSLLLTNFNGIRDTVPMINSNSLSTRIAGWTLMFLGAMFTLDMAAPPSERELTERGRQHAQPARKLDGEYRSDRALDAGEGGGSGIAAASIEKPPPDPSDTPSPTSIPSTSTPMPPTVVPATATAVPPTIAPTAVPAAPTEVPPPPPPVQASPGNVVISYIFYNGLEPRWEGDEYAEITNQGGVAVNLRGWRLNAGDDGQDFWFPDFDLAPGQSCRVYTDEVHPEHCGFNYGRGAAIWNNDDPDCGILYNAEGVVVSEYCY